MNEVVRQASRWLERDETQGRDDGQDKKRTVTRRLEVEVEVEVQVQTATGIGEGMRKLALLVIVIRVDCATL